MHPHQATTSMNVSPKGLPLFAPRRSIALAFVPVLCGAFLACGLTSVAEDGSDPDQQVSQRSPSAPGPGPSNDAPYHRLREGTQLANELGTFKPAGERIMFLSATGKGRYLCLENLNLERIGRLVRDNSENLQWEISGTVTEYGGANYLAVSRAILRSKTRSRKESN